MAKTSKLGYRRRVSLHPMQCEDAARFLSPSVRFPLAEAPSPKKTWWEGWSEREREREREYSPLDVG